MRFRSIVNIALCTLVLIVPVAGVGAAVLSEDFHTPVWDQDRWVVGSTTYLAQDNGTTVFDSGRGDASRYRYMSMLPAAAMGGDFEAEWTFQLRRLDQWNGISLQVAAQDGSWSAKLTRQQRGVGEEQVVGTVEFQGKKAEQVRAESAAAGSFRVRRAGSKLTLFYQPPGRDWGTVLGPVAVGTGPATASLYFWSPANTRNIVAIRSYRQEWQTDTPNHMYPVYGTTKILADEKAAGGVRRMAVEKGVIHGDAIDVRPGGRAVFAVQLPLNVRGMSLNFESRGALKVSVTQVGSAESIQLGSTVLWDERPDNGTRLAPRAVALEDLLSRYPEPKRIQYTHLTANNVFFITFQPATSQAISIRSLAVSGSCLLPIRPFAAARTVQSRAQVKDAFLVFGWGPVSKAADWWGNASLAAGKAADLCAVPFKICPTVLNDKQPSVAIPIHAKAGLFHFAHCAGEVRKDKDWAGAYLIVYDDNTTETVFCNLGWNVGSYFGSNWSTCPSMTTWWGPAGMPFGDLHKSPRPPRGVAWNGVYVSTYLNPHPEKSVDRIMAYAPPGAAPFALVGLTLTPPDKARLGLVEPNEAAFAPGRELRADVMIWSPNLSAGGAKGNLRMSKPAKSVELAELPLTCSGRLGFASYSGTPAPGLMTPGPVTLQYCSGGKTLASSSVLGWMPAPAREDEPFYLTMIGGGFESRWEFERMRRLGYDAIKIHMSWEQVEPQAGKFDFSQWERAIPDIHREGLAVAVRNWMDAPSWLRDNISWRVDSRTGKPERGGMSYVDMGDPAFSQAIVRHYTAVARFLKAYPYVISINANYGTRGVCGRDGMLYYGPHHLAAFRKLLAQRYTLAQVNARTGRQFTAWDRITPEAILADKTSFLLEQYVRAQNRVQAELIRRVAEGIRSTGNTAHLVFNVSMHNQWHTLGGHPLEQYLKVGREFPPASPFHESCDRYSLSFYKWLAAKRTFDLPYGDEGCLTPPPHEQNQRAYEWMMMFQCREACYCQWWSGRPAVQNIAWLKPYYHLIYNAEYVPDPVTLAFSFESGFAEAPTEWREGDTHKPMMCHYGLANTLRALNLNADRYVMDRFPEMDAKAGRLIIDDTSRRIDDGFADRLEKFVRNGGVFVASPDTDLLRDWRFLGRFGLTLSELPWSTRMIVNGGRVSLPGAKFKVGGRNLTTLATWEGGAPAVVVCPVGKGKIILFGKTWDQGDYDVNLPDEYLNLCRQILCKGGEFSPNVGTDTVCVYATPYRARDGRLLVNLYNDTAVAREVRLKVRKDLLKGKAAAWDLGTEAELSLQEAGSYWQVTTRVPALRNTIVRF